MGPASSGTASNQRHERESFISEVPDWIEVEELPWKERCEIQLYKLVSLVPVSVTFCLYIYLFVYYTAVSFQSTFLDRPFLNRRFVVFYSSICIRRFRWTLARSASMPAGRQTRQKWRTRRIRRCSMRYCSRSHRLA